MTIAAGLVCHDGIVLCADTQESYGEYKWPVEKLVVDQLYGFPLMLAGAGFGPAIDTATEKIVKKLQGGFADDITVVHHIEDTLREITERDLEHHPSKGQCDVGFELLIAFKTKNGKPRLYSSHGSLVKRVKHFSIIGAGVVVRFFAHGLYPRTRLGDRPILTVSRTVPLAAYLCYLAKAQINTIGGRSQIATLTSDGDLNFVEDWRPHEWERFFHEYQRLAGDLMLDCAYCGESEDDFERRLGYFVQTMRAFKSGILSTDASLAQFWKPVTDARILEKEKNQAKPRTDRSTPRSSKDQP